jgi:Tfp pilus assembly protein PilV
MFKRLRKNKKGLTLSEVLIALLISMLLVGPFIRVFTVSRLALLKAQNRLIATDLVKAQMEWIEAQEYSYLVDNIVGNPLVENNVDESEIGIDILQDDTRRTQVESYESGNYLEVTVMLNWSKQGLTGSLEKGTIANPDEKIVTLIAKH